MTSKRMSCTEEHEYLCGLKFLFELLAKATKEAGLRCAVVGGVAFYALLGKKYETIRQNGTTRDIDLVGLEDPCNSIEAILELLRSRGYRLPVYFSHPKPENYKPSLMQVFSQLKRTGDGYSIVFREIEMLLTPKACELHEVSLITAIGTIPMQTFHPRVLLLRYLIRMGMLKRKDVEKVKKLALYCAKHGDDYGFLNRRKDCRPFNNFAKDVRNKYPLHMRMLLAYDRLDYMLNSSLSHRLPHFVLRYFAAI